MSGHVERLEKLLKESPGILREGLTAHEDYDVRTTLAELKQLRKLAADDARMLRRILDAHDEDEASQWTGDALGRLVSELRGAICDRVTERDDEEPTAQPAEQLPDRQAKLLAVIRSDGGDWSPMRAQKYLRFVGYAAVSKERAHQIMKQLAERGHLEPVRPRAYTYRLKTEPTQ